MTRRLCTNLVAIFKIARHSLSRRLISRFLSSWQEKNPYLIQSKFHFRLLIHKRELIVDARDARAAAVQESGKRVEEGDGNLHKKLLPIMLFSVQQQCWPQKW